VRVQTTTTRPVSATAGTGMGSRMRPRMVAMKIAVRALVTGGGVRCGGHVLIQVAAVDDSQIPQQTHQAWAVSSAGRGTAK